MRGDELRTRKALPFLIFVILLGCGDAENLTITIRKVRVWPLCADGNKIPAPRAVASGRDDEVIVLDTAARVLVYDKDGALKRWWRMPQTEAGNPEGACVLKDGRIAVADTHYHRVTFFDQEGKIAGQLGREGRKQGEFIYPVSIVQDDKENIYIAEYGGNDRVQKFTREGEFLTSFGQGFGTGAGQFQRPSGMVWHGGKIYIADAINNRIQVFSDSGEFVKVLGTEQPSLSLHYPYDIALGRDGVLYVVEYGACRVSRISLEGRLLGRYGSSGSGHGQFSTPWGVAVDSGLRIIVADTRNRRVVELRQ